MTQIEEKILEGLLLDEGCSLTLADLSRACASHAEWVIELVEEGILEPQGREMTRWRFSGPQLRRAQMVRHLQDDLGVNLAGAALALELIEEIERLRSRLRRYEPDW